MGEHGTWFDYLNRLPFWHDLNREAEGVLGRGTLTKMFPTGWTLLHVLVAALVTIIIAIGAINFFRGMRGKDKGIVPPPRMTFRHAFEYLAETTYNMVESALGEKNAKKFYPLVGALWFFIFFGNLFALIPGFVSSNDTLKTNVGLALFVFLVTHVMGFKTHGIGYIKHFMGPVWWLAWLMFPIELISHIARPVSLSLRLMGNMLADHKVVMSFFALFPLFVPVPFLLLGLLVCVIQALVFCSLTLVYFGMALESDH